MGSFVHSFECFVPSLLLSFLIISCLWCIMSNVVKLVLLLIAGSAAPSVGHVFADPPAEMKEYVSVASVCPVPYSTLLTNMVNAGICGQHWKIGGQQRNIG